MEVTSGCKLTTTQPKTIKQDLFGVYSSTGVAKTEEGPPAGAVPFEGYLVLLCKFKTRCFAISDFSQLYKYSMKRGLLIASCVVVLLPGTPASLCLTITKFGESSKMY